jgi:hypothetical protein
MFKKRNCTVEAMGKIVAVKDRGMDYPTMIRVEYIANGLSYELEESLKLKTSAIKLGPIHIGQKSVPVLKHTAVGSIVRVLYNSADPQEAYLPDNVGLQNV